MYEWINECIYWMNWWMNWKNELNDWMNWIFWSNGWMDGWIWKIYRRHPVPWWWRGWIHFGSGSLNNQIQSLILLCLLVEKGWTLRLIAGSLTDLHHYHCHYTRLIIIVIVTSLSCFIFIILIKIIIIVIIIILMQ